MNSSSYYISSAIKTSIAEINQLGNAVSVLKRMESIFPEKSWGTLGIGQGLLNYKESIQSALSGLDNLQDKIKALNIAGFSEEQIKVALATDTLTESQIQQQMVLMGLTSSYDGLTVAQVAQNAIEKASINGNKEVISTLIEKSGLLELNGTLIKDLSREELENMLIQQGLEKSERDQIYSLLGLNSTMGTSIAETGLFSGALTKLKIAFMGLSTVAKIAVGFLAVFAAIKIGQTVFNTINTSFDELQEKAQDSSSALEETQQKLNSLESQLEDVKSQIDSFDGKTLTLVEEQELSKLRDTQTYLENMIALQKQNESVQAKTAMEDAYNALNQEAQDDFTFGAFFTGKYDFGKKSSLDKAEDKLQEIKKLQNDIDKDKRRLEELDLKNLDPTNNKDVLKYEEGNAILVAIEQNEKMLNEAKDELTTLQAENAEFATTIQENNYDALGNAINKDYDQVLQRYNKINTDLRILNESASQVIQDLVSDLSKSDGYSYGKSAAQGLLGLSEEDLKNPALVDDISNYVEEIQKQLNAKGYGFSIEDIKVAFNIDTEQMTENAKDQIEEGMNSNLFKDYKVNLNSDKISGVAGIASLNTVDDKNSKIFEKNAKLINEYKNIVLNANNEQLSVLKNADWSDQAYQKAYQNYPKIKELYSDIVKYMNMPNDPDSYTGKISRSDMFDALIKRGEEVGISVQDMMEKYSNGILTLNDVVLDQLTGITNELNSNIEDSMSSTVSVTDETAQRIAKSFSNMWSNDEWREANSDMVDLAKQSIVTAQDVEELAATDETLANILNEQGMSAQFAANCLNEIGAGGSIFGIITADALSLNGVLNELADAFSKVTTARSEYEAKMEKEDYNGDFQSYASAYDDIMTDFEKGEYGQKFWARAEYLLGEDSWTMNVKEVYEAVKALDGVLDDSDSNGLGMLEKLSKLDFKELNLDSYVNKNGDGGYNWEIKANELEDLADAAGMSTEAFVACLKALGMYEGVQFYDTEKLEESLKGMNIAMEDTKGNAVLSKQALMEMFTNLGYTGKEAVDLLAQIEEMSGIKLLDFDVDEKGMDSFLKKLGKFEEFSEYDFSSKKVNFESFVDDLHTGLGMSGEDISNFVSTMEDAGYQFVDASGNAVEGIDLVNRALNVGKPNEYAKSVEEATTQLNELKSAVDELPDGEEKLKLEADIKDYERQINEASEATGWVPEEVVTKLTFEIDKAQILQKIEESKRAAQWAASEDQRKEYQAQQLTAESEYVNVNKNQMNMSTKQWEKSSFGTMEQIAVQLNVDGNQDEALKTMETLRSVTDNFSETYSDIDFSKNPKEAEKYLAQYEDTLEKVTGIKLSPDMSTEDLDTFINKYQIMIDGCNQLGIEINWENPEEAQKQLQGILDTYDSVAAILQERGLEVDVNTEKGREKIVELLSQLPPEILTDILANPEKALEVLNNYIQVAEDGTITLTLGADATEAKNEWRRAKNKIEGDTATSSVDADTTLYRHQVSKEISNTERKEAKVKLTADTSPIQAAINRIKGTTINVTLKGSLRGSSTSSNGGSITKTGQGLKVNGTAHLLGTAYATGRWGIPSAEKGVLTGELGPETVVDPNTGEYYTVGDRGPEIVDLPKNAIVFNHLQTKSLFENGYAFGRGKVTNGSAHAIGTAYLGGNATKKVTYKNISDGESSTSKSSSKSSSKSKSSSGSNSKSSSSKSSSSSKETAKETAEEVSSILSEAFGKFYDWIEVRVDRLDKKMSYYEAKANNYGSYSNQNKMIDYQISTLKSLISTDQKGYSKYMAQANKVASYGKGKLNSSQRSQVDNAIKAIKNGGTINIASYADEVRTVVEEYKNWYDKALDMNTALEENKSRLQELAATKLENIQTYYGNRNDLRSTNISNKQALIDYTQSKNNHSLSTSSYGNSVHYNQIKDAYNSIISDSIANAKSLAEERSKLQSQLNAEVKKGNIKKYSNTWYEWQNAINALSSEIYNAKSQTQEYYKALYNLPIEKATQAVEKLSNALNLLKSKASVVAGGSPVYDRIVAADAKTAMNSRKNNLENASNKVSSSKSKLQNTLKKSKVSKSVKDRINKGIKNGTTISTSGLSGALLDAVNEYNASISNYNNASKQYKTAQSNYSKAVMKKKSNENKYNYTITNKYLDQEVENVKKQNSNNQAALRAANANLANAKADKDSKNKTLKNKQDALLKYKLSASQKKAVKEGKTVSTSGLSGKALKAAKEYNKAVEASTKSTNKYNAALSSQKEASDNAAQSQIDYAETMQEVAKEAFDNVVSEFDSMCNKLASDIDKLQSKLDYLEATGGSYDEQTATLKKAYDTTSKQADKQYEAIQKAQSEYDKRKNNMTDEDRLAAQAELNDMWSDYYNLLVQKKELQNQILELNNKQNFDDNIDKLDRTIDNLETERELLDDTKFDTSGNITDSGSREIEILEESINNANKQIDIYERKIEALNQAYKEGKLTEQEYTEQVRECEDAINDNKKAIKDYTEELKELREELALRPFDSMIEDLEEATEDLETQRDLLDDFLVDSRGNLTQSGQEHVNSLNQSITTAEKEITIYEGKIAELNRLYAEGTITQEEYEEQVRECEVAINNNKKAIKGYKDELKDLQKELLLKPFESQIEDLENATEDLQSALNLLDETLVDSKGNLTSAGVQTVASLNQQIANTNKSISVYQQKMIALNQAYASGVITEEEYREQTRACEEAINDSKEAIKDYQDALKDIQRQQLLNPYDTQIDELEERAEELQLARDLLHTSLIDSKGNITSAGQDEISAIAGLIQNSQNEITAYEKKMQALNEAYQRGLITEEEYNDQMRECRSAIRDNKKEIQSYKNELVDLYKEQMEKELDALDQIIDKRKKALQSMKDYYDYADSIKDQNKDIETLQAEIAALEGVIFAHSI